VNLRKVNDEVFIALDPIVQIGGEEIAFLKRQARANSRGRARICAHKANDDALHEMVIAIAAESYIHPHRHLGKSESFHIVEGEVDIVVFDEGGKIVDIIDMGTVGSGRKFYYRLSESVFHTLLIRTDFLVVHEVTNGPFLRDKTVLAPFAPSESEPGAARDYMAMVAERAGAFRRAPQPKVS
jgi:cupin fold WbuC family metalloprotein